MTNITQQTSGTESGHIPLGAKLQNARESMRLDRKDAAAQLRLNENVIDMIENNSFPDTMPQIFIRGYIRSYGKLVQLSDEEVQAGLEPIKPRQVNQETQLSMPVTQMEPLNKRKYLMPVVTAGIALTLVWLVAAWWHGHNAAPETTAMNQLAQPEANAIPAGISAQLTPAANTLPVTSLATQPPATAPLAVEASRIHQTAIPSSAREEEIEE